jgi:ubiquinone/menaquinone biosynthesis C-methylase UbiE
MKDNQVPKGSRPHSSHRPQVRTTEGESLYLLGHSQNEELRLRRQAEELRHESARLLDRLKLRSGDRAIDLGCGPQGVLDLLSERVGVNGSVVGVEKNDMSVGIAKRFVANRKFNNVEVIHGDATATGLPEASFDLVHSRLVLVNVPNVEAVVNEMTRLARPAAWLPVTRQITSRTSAILLFEPGTVFSRSSKSTQLPTASTFMLVAVRTGFSVMQGSSILKYPIVSVFPHGHNRRMIFWDFLQNVRDRILEQKLMDESEFDELTTELKEHLDRSNTLVVSHLFFQVWGRKPI